MLGISFVVIGFVLFLILVILIAMSCVKVVPQAKAYVVERLGAYQGTWSTGIHFKVPFIDRVANKVNLKEQVVDFPPPPLPMSLLLQCLSDGRQQLPPQHGQLTVDVSFRLCVHASPLLNRPEPAPRCRRRPAAQSPHRRRPPYPEVSDGSCPGGAFGSAPPCHPP